MDEDRRPRIPDRWILPGLAEEHAPFPGCAPVPRVKLRIERAGVEIGSDGRMCAAAGTCRARSVRMASAAARVLIHDVKQRWAPPKASPGFGERPAERLAASQSVVIENTFGPGRCAVVANVSWTSGPTAEPRWLGQADRRKRASPPAGCFDGDIGARKPPAVNRSGGSPRWPRARLQRETLSDWRRIFSKNRSSHPRRRHPQSRRRLVSDS